MSRIDEIERQTRVRHALHANGYVPLANDDKRCMLPGWPTREVTHEDIDGWSNALRYRGTGVRIDPPLAVIDVDIDDFDAINAVLDALPGDIVERLEEAPERRGKGEKVAWFIRAAEPFTRYATMAFCKGDPEAEDAVLERIEVFGGKVSRQFGVYGAHTIENGEVKIEYEWNGSGLFERHIDELPEFTEDEIELICDTANIVLEDLGWNRHREFKGGKTDPEVIYDLTEDMVFETKDHGDLDLDELEAAVARSGEVRLSASWLEGPAARNKTRCRAVSTHEGGMQIVEFDSGSRHRPVRDRPGHYSPDLREAFRKMTENAKGGLFAPGVCEPEAKQGDNGEAVFEAGGLDLKVAELLQNYAFAAAEHKPVIPIHGGEPMTLGNFKVQMAPHAEVEIGPKGGVTTHNPVDYWRTDPNRIDVIGRRYMPWTNEILARYEGLNPGEGAGLAVNTYRAPQHRAAGEGLEVWHDFLEHLIPDREERDWFYTWMASKVQFPAVPNVAVLMTTPVQGTGRGTLADILRQVLGSWNCSTIGAGEMTGETGQSQYNEWLTSAVLVVCEELLLGGDTGSNMNWKRRKLYEATKTMFDPRPRPVHVVRKGESNYRGYAVASFFLSTNNPNALPLDEGDRRVAVISNTWTKLRDTPLDERLQALRNHEGSYRPGFVAAIHEELRSLSVDRRALVEAPHFAGRAAMMSSNRGDLDDILDDAMSKVPGDFITKKDLRRRIAKEVEGDSELKGWWAQVRDILSRPNRTGWRVMAAGARQWLTTKEQNQRDVVYMREAGVGEEGWHDTPCDERERLWSRGSDLNDTLSRAREVIRERGWDVHDGGSDEP